MTVVEAPQRPQPSQDELEALIEEARRRARRRRLLLGGAVVAVLGAAGLAIGLVLASRGGEGTAVPRGFHLVRARGPVQHALVETVVPPAAQTLDLATGREHRARETQEVWWDPKSGLTRTRARQDGRLLGEWVEQKCRGTGRARFCIPPAPFDFEIRGLGWPPKAHFARTGGTGTFRGHRVVWVESMVQPGEGKRPYPSGERVAYDAVTHRRLAVEYIGHGGKREGRVFTLQALKSLPTLEPSAVTFAVPDSGAGLNTPSPDTQERGR